jgi:nucleolar GTP-binding protein
LLEYRLGEKAKDEGKLEKIMNRVHVAMPSKRDNIERPPHIPERILEKRKEYLTKELTHTDIVKQMEEERKNRITIKDLQEKNGGSGVFFIPLQEHFMLQENDWKYDNVPQILNGKNIADFVDKDILLKVKELEKEEQILLQMDQNLAVF